MQKITPFFLFEGTAEDAIHFYLSLFAESTILSLSRYEQNEEGPAGSVRHALFSLNGQEFMAIDSAVRHEFTFTPALSLHVRCETEAEWDRLYAALTEGGQILMPLDAYPFSRKYAWVNDKYGVSWQLNLADG